MRGAGGQLHLGAGMTPGDEKVPRVASVSECLKHRVSGALQSQGPGSARLNTWFVQGGHLPGFYPSC